MLTLYVFSLIVPVFVLISLKYVYVFVRADYRYRYKEIPAEQGTVCRPALLRSSYVPT